MTDQHPSGDLGFCRSCSAPIVWYVTPSGKRAILDAEPVPTGNIEIIDGKAVTLTAVVKAAPPRGPRFISHWVSCPDREAWKARKAT
jgi:hypothetical protein